MPFIFLALLIAAAIGILRPYRGWKRWHFAIGAFVAFVGMGLTVPHPTPQELAARKAAKEAETAAAAAVAAKADDDAAAAEAKTAHSRVVEKAQAALELAPRYSKAEYGQTFTRVGGATFAKLNELEPGAAYAAAESGSCDAVASAMVSDQSKRGKAVWSVDCANGNRFMIDQVQATAALARFKQNRLSSTMLDASCTVRSVSLCKASPAQRAVGKREVEFVTSCDLLLEQAVVSPSSLAMQGAWSTAFGEGDTIIFRRAFDSQNSFGATIRSKYRCDVDAITGKVSRFEVQSPLGTKRFT